MICDLSCLLDVGKENSQLVLIQCNENPFINARTSRRFNIYGCILTIVSDIAPNEKSNMKPKYVLHAQEGCEASLRTKRESLGTGISRYRKEDKMSI